MIKALSFFFIFGLSLPSSAAMKSDIDFNLGFSSINITAGEDLSQRIESYSTVEVNYNMIMSSMSTVFNISFQEFIDSTYGNLAYARLGVGAKWYPKGLSSQRVIFENQVIGQLFKPTPFIGLNLGLANLSVDDNSDPFLQASYNASVIDAIIQIGLETPLNPDWLLTAHFGYVQSLMSNAQGDQPALVYTGFQVLIGVKLTNF